MLRLTPETKSKKPLKPVPEERQPTSLQASSSSSSIRHGLPYASNVAAEEEDLFDMISRAQSKRLDDQRCSFVANKENHHHVGNGSTKTGTAHTTVRTFEVGLSTEIY